MFGSAGVIGNPMGFARSMGLGIRDFLSVPAKSIMQSPVGLITGMAQGTTSLLSNTVYAISDATSQFSKAARKGIVAFTYDDQVVSKMEKQQAIVASGSKGVINEVLEGLTGLLQSPIRGAERHGLPGVLSGIALGITGLVAKPAASILEVTGKTALSIRNRSKPNQIRSQRFRVRIPRPLSGELPLRPYSWEEAVGACVLMEGDDGLKYKDEKLVVCKALKEDGKFVVLTERFILVVFCPNLVKLGKPEFCGIPAETEWIIESEIGLESVIHADTNQGVVQIVGSRPDTLLRQHQHSPKRGSRTRAVRYNHFSTHLPLSQTNLELASEEDAHNFLQILLSSIENGKHKGWGSGHFLHRVNIK
ncbi:putative vacuolar protein sorting-associated protein 13A [Senna tora]|uniref:Putative vacuolar protein sorting-associated protein 13A n=1 Tax=Senna tora TaxID=362788 RepID=A0A834TN91_9FABA|nr:putative vacuolar protein sorting-associated protein 13A [Senna tora]